MRPERLELEGFTAFRRRTEVDLSGAELFALCGPTGAGKSSLIDAITFALYGSVARYDDDRLVAPIISQGLAEARVRLDFSVGEQRFTAVRVVRTTSAGKATTKEARLERHLDGAAGTAGQGEPTSEVLAGDAHGVTAEVERLLGLGFRQLTTCVVLPQGQFARFLHAKPAERQDLLVRLLDLGLYGEMATRARERAVQAQARAAAAEAELEKLAAATPDALAAATGRIDELEVLLARIEEAQPELDRLGQEAAGAEADLAEQQQRLADLQGVALPEGIERVAHRATMAREELAQARRDLAAADLVLERTEERASAAPPLDEARRAVERASARDDLRESLAEVDAVLAEHVDDEHRTAKALERAEEEVVRVRGELDAARLADRAADLRGHLHEGEPCPVCTQVVAEVPPADRADLDRAERSVAEAESERRATQRAHRTAATELSKAEVTRTQLVERLDQLDALLEGSSDRAELERALAERERLDADLDRARQAVREARRAVERAEGRHRGLEQQERSLRDEWMRTQERVLRLGTTRPPEPTDDLLVDWRKLVDWVEFERPILARQAESARQAARQHERQRDRVRQDLVAAAVEHGLDPGERPPRDACVEALASVRAERARLEAAVDERAHQEAELARQRERGEVAEELHRLLGARNFERWVLDEVFERLVAGATEVLQELSAGAYSLARSGRGELAVVDHTNADAERSARTLSGGETFLASLALALALADRVADLSAVGARRLEAIFLDEGFGALDPDTLDVVATAIEELGAQGRTVGIVTHVRELAERLPVRFEVTKGPEGASVERVEV